MDMTNDIFFGQRIVLGTAQFGLNYGVSNVGGRPALGEVDRILCVAKSLGVDTLDTAAVYGDAEDVLGALPQSSDFSVITKTSPARVERIGSRVVAEIGKMFDRSLARLRRDKVTGILVHHSGDLLKPGADLLYRMLSNWKAAGRVDRIGVSIYAPDEADLILSRYPIDLIQLPLNVIDQRALRTGLLDRLQSAGVEVHTRSVFLQGALLMPLSDLPAHLAVLRPRLVSLADECLQRGWSVQEACLRFVLGIDQIGKLVCGVNTSKELSELVSKARPGWAGFDFSPFALDDTRVIHPSEWPSNA